MSDNKTISKSLKGLGQSARLSIFTLLVRHGKSGMPVGKIQKTLGIPGSTLSHHLAVLVSGGLIIQQRKGRILLCLPAYNILEDVIHYFKSECCIISPQSNIN